MGDSKMGLQARLMSQAMRKLTGAIGRTGCCCVFINQLREKIGVMFGNPETTTGGNALKFYASVRIDIMYGEGISKTGEIVDMGVDHDIIQKSGSWYAYNDAKIAQGREAAKQFLADNPEVALEIEAKIKDLVANGLEAEEEPEEADKAPEVVATKATKKAKKGVAEPSQNGVS